jgi:hypothetical protein
MFKTKFENNDVEVVIEDSVQKDLMSKGINPVEVFRLIESFASKILTSKQDEAIQLTNEDSGASLALDVKWKTEMQVIVTVSVVNLENLKVDPKPISKVNLAELAAQVAQSEQAA